MLALILRTVLLGAAPIPSQAPDLGGYYTLQTILNGSAATVSIRLTRNDSTYIADVMPASGGAPVRGGVTVNGKEVTVTAHIHGSPIRFDLTIDGENVTGRWLAAGADGQLTGKKTKDPGAG